MGAERARAVLPGAGRVTAGGGGGGRGQEFRVGSPTRLVEGRYYAGGGSGAAPGRTYDVSPDGQRFLMVKEGAGADQAAAPPSIVVVQNWQEELKRLVPTR